MKTMLKAPATKRLNSKYDELLSRFASISNLRCYCEGLQVKMTIVAGGETAVVGCSPVNVDTGKGSCAPPLAFLFASLWSLNQTEVGTVVLGAYYSGSSSPAAASDIVSITLPRRPTHIASTGGLFLNFPAGPCTLVHFSYLPETFLVTMTSN
jgi:hypothetical protein